MFSKLFRIVDSQNIEMSNTHYLVNDLVFFLDSLECPGVSKDEEYWLWGLRDTAESPAIIEMRGLRVLP